MSILPCKQANTLARAILATLSLILPLTAVAQTPTNLALGKPVTASVASTQAALSIVTDNTTTTTPFVSLAVGQQWIEVDLQGDYDISRLQFFHYWGDGRTYHDV